MGFKLREYQVRADQDIIDLLLDKKNNKGLAVLPTGGGKSILVANAARQLGKPILVLQPSKELLVQNYRKFKAYGGEASICCASLKEKTINGEEFFEIEPGEWKRCDEVTKVTFATVGTVKKFIDKLKDLGVKHLIIDEAHLGTKSGSQTRKLIRNLKATHVVGLTATPLYLEGGMNGSRLVMINRAKHSIFRNIIHVTQIDELVKNKYWSPLKYEVYESDTSKLKMNSSGSEYTEDSIRRYYDDNNLEGEVIKKTKELLNKGRKRILIFVPSIDDAESLKASFGKGCGIVHSKMDMKDRDDMVRRFGTGEINVMVNVNILSIGYDNPLIDSIIATRPTSSIAIYKQQLGRGVRIHPDKKDCIIVDYSGNVKSFGKIEGLHYEKLKYYGWGLFNSDNELLSDYPIQSKIRPTKESLISFHEEKLALDGKEEFNDKITFYFGKFKGKTLGFVYTHHKDYLVWIADQENFNWYGQKGESLRNAIFKKLMLPIPQGHFEIDESWRDKKEEEEDNKLDKLLGEFNIDRPF